MGYDCRGNEIGSANISERSSKTKGVIMDEMSNEIVSNLDQSIPVDMLEALDEVDSIVSQAKMFGNPDLILDEIRANLSQVRVSGLSLCKLVYKLHELWDELGDGQDFDEAVFSHTGLGSTTINR